MWQNPSAGQCSNLSTTVTARLNGTKRANCSVQSLASSSAQCTLKNLNNCEEYEIVVIVCIAQDYDAYARYENNPNCKEISSKGHWTLPGVPDMATMTEVIASAFGELQVNWTNPNTGKCSNLSAIAIASKDGSETVNCSVQSYSSSNAGCTLEHLQNCEAYKIVVKVCTIPMPGTNYKVSNSTFCNETSPVVHWTVPGVPEEPTLQNVISSACEELQVIWTNPNTGKCSNLSTKVFASRDGSEPVTCGVLSKANISENCLLKNLDHYTLYAISVEVCTIPMTGTNYKVPSGTFCRNGSSENHRTLPGVFQPNQSVALGKELAKSDASATDPKSQIRIKVALSTLPIEDVGPVSKVTAYIQLSSQPSSNRVNQTHSTNCTPNGIPSFMHGSYNSSTWAPWEVVIPFDNRTFPQRLQDVDFTIGNSFDSENCDHCYNGPLSWHTCYWIGLNVYTETGVGMTELHEHCTAHNIALIVGVTVPCVVVLAAVLFVVFWLKPGPCWGPIVPGAEPEERIQVDYEPKPEPTLDRSQLMLPMSFNDFDAHTKLLASDDALSAEFKTLDYFTNQQIGDYKLDTSISAATTNLNRYADMIPYDQSIVRLDRDWGTYCRDQQPIGPLISEVPQLYINANYVKACAYDALGRAEVASKTTLPEYIATQAPLTHTEADFLYMVHQQRSPVVIMLCNTFEGGKNKCGQYWPDAEGFPEPKQSLTRTVTVTLQQTIPLEFMVTRVLTVQPEGESKPWTFTQLHFLGWADHAVPDMKEFYQLYHTYKGIRQEKPLSLAYGPTVVHCSAGVGRTGTLICADMLLEQLHKNRSQIDVFGTVLASRVFRRRFVQVQEQLRFLYEFLDFCIAKEGLDNGRPVKAPALAAPSEYDLPKSLLPSAPVIPPLAPKEEYSLPKGPLWTAPALTTINPLQNQEYSLPKRELPSGSSLGQPSTVVPLRTVPAPPTVDPPQNEEYSLPKKELPSAHGASIGQPATVLPLRTVPGPPTVNPLQNKEYSLPKRELPSGSSLGQPSTVVPLRTVPAPPTVDPPQNEEYSLPKKELPSVQGAPVIPPRPIPPPSNSHRVGVDAQIGRFVLPDRSRPV